MEVEVIITHLELRERAWFRPSGAPVGDFQVTRLGVPLPEFNRFLYATAGRDWVWRDRLGWSRSEWAAYVAREELETWVATVSGTPAGYFELETQEGGSVEIVYLGLLPAFLGRGLGGPLLSAAVGRAWETGAARVWLHTCSLDHPGALPNYRARGFREFKTERRTEVIADQPPELWPGERGG